MFIFFLTAANQVLLCLPPVIFSPLINNIITSPNWFRHKLPINGVTNRVQVARPSMNDSGFLEEAVARYKGFLHLIKKNQETSTNHFCVPMYDIDLIWHSHQLQPSSYCKDMLELLGKILGHDDTDADRTKGKKLDTGFCETTKQWEDTFGLRYWRAGALYRGSTPSSLDVTPYFSGSDMKNEDVMKKSEKLLPLQKTMVVEVLLEIVGVKNLPAGQNGNLFVSFSKKSPDIFLNGSSALSILSESGEKQVAGFQCEPTGELILALKTNSNSHIKTMGTTSIPLEDLMTPNSKLSVEKWFELKPHTGNLNGKPVSLYVAASFTVPFPAPQEFRMFKSSPISMNTCFFPLKAQQVQRWVRFVDENGNDIISLQMRRVKQNNGMNNGISKRNIVGVTRLSKKPQVLAEYAENKWSLKDYNLSLCIEKENRQGAHIFELSGYNQIKLFPGKKLEYEPKNCHHIELNFITAVEFSADHPYGRAIALLDIESSLIKVEEDQFVLPAILLLFILKKEGFTGKNTKQMENRESKTCHQTSEVSAIDALTTQINSGGCGGGCSGVYGNTLDTNSSGGCGGGGCSGGCGTTIIAGSGSCKAASMNYGSGACKAAATNVGSGACKASVTNFGSGACKASVINVDSGSCGGGCGGACGKKTTGAASGGCGGGCGITMNGGGCGGCGGGCGGGARVSVGEVVSVAA